MNRKMMVVAVSVPAFLVGCWIAASLHVLYRLDAYNLVSTYLLRAGADSSPVTFPVPRLIIDFYWVVRGRSIVSKASEEGTEIIKFVTERIGLADRLGEPLDGIRAQDLLGVLVCEKSSDLVARHELEVFQVKASSAALGKALRGCMEQ
jgi:hypothetical protein